MRIGIDARMYGIKSTTGIGAYIKALTDRLFLIDQKNEYFLFMAEPVFSEFIPPNKRIHKIKVDCPWYSWQEQIKMPLILLRYNLKLVHFPHFNVPLLYPKKFIVTIHDITPKFFPGPVVKKSLIRRVGYKLIFWLGVKRAKKIITVSHHTKNNLIKYFKVNPKKIEAIHLGVNDGFFEINDQQSVEQFKKLKKIDWPFIFYIGVWRDHKNLVGLVKAFDLLRQKYQLKCQLVLGGQPDWRYPEINEAIDHSLFKKDIILPGFIPQEEVNLFYNAAWVFVLPSFCEGFGLVALEAIKAGTPVVASLTTSLPEILDDAALYFDPHQPDDIAQKIYQVFTDQTLRTKLKTRGLDQIKKYDWTNCAQATLELYRQD